MFDDSILTINELAKVRASAGTGGGGAGTQFNTLAPIAKSRFIATSLDTTSYGVNNQSSQSYTKTFNHGEGQFSFANGPTYYGGLTRSEFYVKPFQVNQTTGAITEGTGSALWTNTSTNGGFSTGTWGQGLNGRHCFHTGHNLFPGNSSNVYGTTAWTVSGNSVTHSTYTVYNSYATVDNQDSFVGVSGSTSYFLPNVSNSNASKHLLSYDGSSLSNVANENLSSNTSTNYTSPVVRQFGTTGPQGGGLHFFVNSNGMPQIRAVSSTGSTQSTVSFNNLMAYATNASTRSSVGLELSNGRQLHYTNVGTIILKDGSTLSNVTSTADYIPTFLNNNKPISNFTPVSQDTWFAYNNSINELVKFRINPTTYKVTIVGSILLTSIVGNSQVARNYVGNNGGIYVTGSNNQFIVAVTVGGNEGPYFNVTVSANRLSGV